MPWPLCHKTHSRCPRHQLRCWGMQAFWGKNCTASRAGKRRLASYRSQQQRVKLQLWQVQRRMAQHPQQHQQMGPSRQQRSQQQLSLVR